MSAPFTVMMLLTALASAVVFGVVVWGRETRQRPDGWAAGMPAALTIACLALLNSPATDLTSAVLSLCIVGISVTAGMVILRDTRPSDARARQLWLGLNSGSASTPGGRWRWSSPHSSANLFRWVNRIGWCVHSAPFTAIAWCSSSVI